VWTGTPISTRPNKNAGDGIGQRTDIWKRLSENWSREGIWEADIGKKRFDPLTLNKNIPKYETECPFTYKGPFRSLLLLRSLGSFNQYFAVRNPLEDTLGLKKRQDKDPFGISRL